MIALWMMYTIATAAVIGVAAAILDRATAGTLRQRRWIWLTALVASTVIPAWTALAPNRPARVAGPERIARNQEQPAPVGLASELGSRFAELMAQADTRALARYDSSLTAGWFVAALLALTAFGVGTLTLAARRRTWRVAKLDGETVLLAPAVGPAVIGAIRPRIVLPVWSLALPPEQRTLILEHERQHVRSRDPLLLHLAALLTLLMPWNVVAWWITRRLRLAVELDCDARVLAAGHDAREYGTLLLDVCARRVRGGPLLAPALFERTSSLTRRILAMHPDRSQHRRTRVALGIVAALAAVIAACEMPSPEMLAPDGKDAAGARVYGNGVASANLETAELRALVAQHFPDVARGEGRSKILFFVRTADAKIVLSESQVADGLLLKQPQMPTPNAKIALHGAAVAVSSEPTRMHATAGEGEIRFAEVPPRADANGAVRTKTRARASDRGLPSGVAALRPDDIESIDVSKHAAGKLAPQPVSIIIIALKQGAVVPR
jgi:hypothetical protein